MNRYVLNDKNVPIHEPDILKASEFMSNVEKRIVVRTQVSDGVLVSTVFLGLDHNHSSQGPPVLWETLVFGGPLSDEMERYTSHKDAVKGHEEMVDRCRKAEADNHS